MLVLLAILFILFLIFVIVGWLLTVGGFSFGVAQHIRRSPEERNRQAKLVGEKIGSSVARARMTESTSHVFETPEQQAERDKREERKRYLESLVDR